MLNMKKDMGGAATVLALAHMIMARELKLRLRVLIPAVENAIAGSAFRPRDVYRSRKGITVEIGNTDAEGRLVLADALALADEEKPELIVDMATLTGAARVALGPDVPPFYTDDDALAAELARHAAPRERSALADAAVAALRADARFQGRRHQQCQYGGQSAARSPRRCSCGASWPPKAWLHFDIYAWTPAAKPGRPEGGECQAARALYALLVRALRLNRWSPLDPRITPARPDLAAKHLAGQGRRRRASSKAQCRGGRAAGAAAARARRPTRRSTPRRCKGERVIVYETTDEGWAWGQLETDGYVGWLPTDALGQARPAADPQGRGRCARSAFRGRRSSCRRSRRCRSARGSRSSRVRTSVRGHGNRLASAGACISCRSTRKEADFVAVAERFLGTPYLWGGKTSRSASTAPGWCRSR